jgi:hypothetical protein
MLSACLFLFWHPVTVQALLFWLLTVLLRFLLHSGILCRRCSCWPFYPALQPAAADCLCFFPRNSAPGCPAVPLPL